MLTDYLQTNECGEQARRIILCKWFSFWDHSNLKELKFGYLYNIVEVL